MGINLNISKDIFLPVYRPYLFDYSHRYNIFYGGRGSGKTVFIIQLLLLKGLKEKRNILLMQKQTNKVKDSVWKELKEAITLFKLNPYFEFNKTDFRAICKLNGSEFRCMGLDEPEKIKGYSQISDVYMDEMTAFTQDDFDLIDGTLRSKFYKLPLQLYGSFNPVSKANWVYKYFGFDTEVVPPNTFILKTTYKDNPFLSQDYLARMENLRLKNPNRYKIEALGDFCTLDRLVFTNWRVEDFDHSSLEGTHITGLDFGFVNDLSALTSSILQEDTKRIYVFQEWGAIGKTNPEIAQIIQNLGLSKSLIIADSAEQKSIEELRRNGIAHIKPSVKGPDSIIHGIQRLQQYELIIHPSCEGLISELENYSWQKDKSTGEYINKPIDQFNHYIDSLRYSLQCAHGQLKVMDKSLLGL